MTAPNPGPGITALGQVSLLVRNAASAEAFYRDAVGLRHLFTFGTLAFFDLEGVRLLLSEPEDSVWRPGSVLYLRVPATRTARRSGWRSSATRTGTNWR
jgi:methylmalonyl-CoA/ethylmalonyl-CoA epimerase